MKEITLPSGVILKIGLAPFADSKELWQALLDQLKSIEIQGSTEVDVDLMKNILCSGLSSKRVDLAVTKCFAKCLYNGVRITEDTFEPEEARQDYLTVFYEVAVANVLPFTKDLFAKLQPLIQMIRDTQKPNVDQII